MTFLKSLKPVIDFGRKSVCVEGKELSVVSLGKPRVVQHVQQLATPTSNSFADLEVNDCVVFGENGVEATQDDILEQPTCARDSALNISCVGCGRQLHGSCRAKCARCLNASFSGVLKQQQRILTASEALLEATETLQAVSNVPAVEVVPLQQFTRGGKRGHYEFCGILRAQDLADESSSHELHFTHRTSHGESGDADEDKGKFSKLANDTLSRLQQKYPEVFAEPKYPVSREGCAVDIRHEIRLKDADSAPPKRRIYPLDNQELEELKKQLQEFVESNRIRPSNSPYGAPILFAKKKGGQLRMCIDYRLLNQQSVVDSFPLPRIDELLQRLDGAAVFSKLDLRDGYHQIPMADQDIPKTAFSCRYGTFEFLVMPFGLSGAPGTFQRLMNQVFFYLLDEGVVCYLDDLLLYTRTVEQHQQLLDRVFSLLSQNKLFLKESKCHLFLEKVNFLGHVVSSSGVAVEQGKVDAIKQWPTPKTVNEVQQFLGLANYYRRFVLRFSEIASPLSQLTRKGHVFQWGAEQQRSFDALKQCLSSTPVLKIFDKNLKTRVVADASNFCVGAVLEQQCSKTGKWHPVEYMSKRLTQSERNYSATDREFVAIRLALERWRHLLIGMQFLILTDHAALTYLQSSQGVNRRNARWLEFLSQYTFDIQHIKGKENIVADTLSRVPGSELLSSLELCSQQYTLGVQHLADVPLKLCSLDCNKVNARLETDYLNGVLSIDERATFRQQLMTEQQNETSKWFTNLKQLANNGHSLYQFRNSLLCKLVGDHFCPIIPDRDSSTVQVVLHDLHTSALGGHLGRRKLLEAAQRRFYWRNMFQSVLKFCKECPVCQQNKGSTQKPSGLLQPLENPSKMFEHVSMDFVMNLPTSDRHYDAIFTIVDRFSRLVRFIPCKSSLTAQDAANLFFEHWICRFGMPQKIISDRDPRFTSVFWQSLCKALGSRVALSTSYHPETDGLTERFHRTVEQVLRCYCSSQQSKWCVLLSQCEFALNNTVQDSHSEVPFRVVYGQLPSMPLDLLLPLDSAHAQDVIQSRADVSRKVQELQAAASARMARQEDRHRKEAELAVGQRVWLSTAHLPLKQGARKLAEKFTGPFTISSRVTREAWRLELPPTLRLHPVFHTSQLKPVQGNPRQAPPIQLADQEEQEYEVESLLDRRTVRGVTQYLVRWKGYSSFDDTWEPLSNLANAGAKVAEFDAGRMLAGSGEGQGRGRGRGRPRRR